MPVWCFTVPFLLPAHRERVKLLVAERTKRLIKFHPVPLLMLARDHSCESPELEPLADECNSAVAFVDLDLCVLLEMIEKVETDVTELADMLKLDVIASSVYGLIAKAIKQHVSV